MFDLSTREKELFDAIRRRQEIRLDDLVDKFAGSRHAMVVRMKYLSAKVAPHGWIIERTSTLGRGSKAVYSVKKRF